MYISFRRLPIKKSRDLSRWLIFRSHSAAISNNSLNVASYWQKCFKYSLSISIWCRISFYVESSFTLNGLLAIGGVSIFSCLVRHHWVILCLRTCNHYNHFPSLNHLLHCQEIFLLRIWHHLRLFSGSRIWFPDDLSSFWQLCSRYYLKKMVNWHWGDFSSYMLTTILDTHSRRTVTISFNVCPHSLLNKYHFHWEFPVVTVFGLRSFPIAGPQLF